MAKLAKGMYSCCALCRKWINEGVAIDFFNVVCLDCAKAIAGVLSECENPVGETPADEPRVVSTDASKLVCKDCGATFTNRGKFLAHRRKHLKDAFESE